MCHRKSHCCGSSSCCKQSDASVKLDASVRHGSHIDRGWGWVIVAAVAGSLFIMMGIGKSLGLILEELKDYFHVPMFRVTMVFGMSAISYTLSAPVALVLGEILSPRVIIMVGASLAFIGMSLSAFMFSIDFIGATFGIFFGIGNGFLYGNALVTVVHYFDRWRSLANGIALAGASVGNFALPPLLQYFLDEYTLRGTLLLMGALYLEIVLFGALMRPISYYKEHIVQNLDRSDCDDVIRFNEGVKSHCSHGNHSHKNMSAHTKLCTIELDQGTQLSDSIALDERGDCEQMVNNSEFPQQQGETEINTACESGERFELLMHVHDSDLRVTQTTSSCMESSSLRDNVLSVSIDSVCKHDKVNACGKCCLCMSPESRSSGKEAFKKMFDFSVLKNRLCLLFLFFTLFAFFGFFNFVLFLPLLGTKYGSYKRALLISICGIADLIGRLVIGAFSDLNLIERYKLMILAHLIIGIDLLVFVFAQTYTQLAIQSAIYGLIGGGYVTLLPVVVIDFVGLEMMPKALAVVLLFQGIAGAVGQVLLGWLFDVTGSYNAVLYLLGGCCLTAAAILMFYPLVQKMERRRCINIVRNTTTCKHKEEVF